jgi:prepilin-type N-terminal cleavage/methylation domain-containing protein
MTSSLTKRNSPAFTLLELLMVLVILGTIVAVSAPRVTRSFHSLAARDAASTLASNMRYAQARAIADGTPVRMVFDQAAGRYSVESAVGPPGAAGPGAATPAGASGAWSARSAVDPTGRGFDLPTGVRFDAVHLVAEDGVTAAESLVFLPDGRGGRGSVRISGREGSFTVALTGRLGQVVTVAGDAPANDPPPAH